MTQWQVDPVVRALSHRLLDEVDVIAGRMAQRIRREVPFYGAGDVVTAPQLQASCADNVRLVLGGLAGLAEQDMAAARQRSARAAVAVPYAAVLQAYRVGGREIWECLVEFAGPEDRDVLIRAAADIWAVTDDMSELVTEAYRTHLHERARQDEQTRAVLVATVLEGNGSAAQRWDAVAALGLPRRGDFVVVMAGSPQPGQPGLPGVEKRLRERGVRSVWRLGRDAHEGVVALRAGYSLDALERDLIPLAVAPVGVSSLFTSLDQAGTARRQAGLACAAATPGSQALMRYDTSALAVLLASTPAAAEAFARRVLGPVFELAAPDRDMLIDTATAWLAEDGATSAVGDRLFIHRNTVRYRLRRLEQLTGRDLSRPVDAAEVYVALECARILGPRLTGDHPSAAGAETGAIQDGAIQDGAIQDGAIQDGAIQDDSATSISAP